jgi:biotin carboxylase
MSKLNYKTSKDYKRLKELLDKGYEVVCIIPSDYPNGNMCAFARIEYSATYPRKKIYVFAEFGFYATEEDFVEACVAKRIEFIEPNGEE